MGSGTHPCEGFRELDPRTLCAPDAPALVRPGQRILSFLQCAAAAAGIARGLQRAGVHRGDLIALAIPNAEDLLLGFLGASGIAAAAPLDCKLAEAELRSRLLLLKPGALLAPAEPDPKLVRAAYAAGTTLLSMQFPSDGDHPPEISLVHPGAAGRRVDAELAAVFQTSATTGVPKHAPLTRGNLDAMILNVQRSFGLRADDRLLCLMPLHHLSGLLMCLAQLMREGMVICANAFDPGRFGEWLAAYRPTWYLAGPAIHRSILQVVQERPDGFRQTSLRFIRSGSAAIQPALVEALETSLRVPVIHGYGMTESGVITSTGVHRGAPGSVGKSIGVTVAIMAPDGSLLPPTAQGEIVLRGPAVMSGYLDDPAANQNAFHNGWFRTGDLGWLDPDGELFITGRIREIINRGGEKILPHEIDAVVAEHPAVAQAAAFAIPHPTLGEDIAAAIVLRPGAVAVESEIRNYLALRVGPASLPSRIFFVDEIPVTATGKPRRRELSHLFAGAAEDRPLPAGNSFPNDAAGDRLEQRIAGIWSRVLGISTPPPENESFFALGGDSLALAQMLAIMEAEMGVDARRLAAPGFLAAPTIAALRDAIVENQTSVKPSFARAGVDAVVLQERGKGPPFFCLPGATLDASYLRPLARLVGDAQPFVVLRDTSWDAAPDARAFEGLVQRFVDYIRDTQSRPLGPIGGHCFGGILAFECACRLEALGWPVPSVVLFDTAVPGYRKPLQQWMQHIKWAPQLALSLRRGTPRAEERTLLASMAEAAAAMMRGYVPRPFGGSVVNFMAAGQRVSSRVLQDARLGWDDFAKRGFKWYRVPGSHDSMFSEEYVAPLAHLLRGILLDSR